MKNLHISFLLLSLLAATSVSAQERGIITGRVVDEQNAESMTRASVRVLGTKLGAFTNTAGEFTIRNVEPGSYTLQVSYAGYATRKIEGVVVRAGQTTRQDIGITLNTARRIVKKERADRQSIGASDIERKRLGAVSDNISAQEIGRGPAADAGDAMKRVTGVSVVGSKYVVVRGLTERYSSTQLNGVNLPSPEPEKKVVPFDIFPSSMVSRMTTIKTFTPDNPGDFAGGLVKIDTKDYPESFLFNVGLGAGINTGTHGGDRGLGYNGGGSLLGVDDGTRALPAGLGVERRGSPQAQADLLSSFDNNVWLPTRGVSPALNRNVNLSIGNRYGEESIIGFLLSGSYAQSSDYRSEEQRYPLLSLDGAGARELRYDYLSDRSEISTLWGGLATVTAQIAPEHRVSVKAVYNHSAEDESRLTEGLYNQSTTGTIRTTRLRFVERSLFSGQLAGEHQIDTTLKLKVDWRAAYSAAQRSEPDNRTTTYIRGDDGIYRFANNFGSGNSRFFSNLDDAESSVGLDLTLPFAGLGEGLSRVKVGGLGRLRTREFNARRFIFNTTTSDDALLVQAPEQLFTPENVRSGAVVYNEETQRTDRYTADESVTAAYAMVDLPLIDHLRLIGGVRFEQWNQKLRSIDPYTDAENAALGVNNSIGDLLPSINFIYALDESMNLRASASRTLARPEFRELAPFRFDDYRQSVYGNPALERTQITNLDLRWEWFPNGGEVLAVSGFYKMFDNPIELFYLKGGSGVEVESANANAATSMGAEFEVRKALGNIVESLEGFSVGMNLTLVRSEVEFREGERVRIFDGVGISEFTADVLTNRTRPMQGQSPYVFNLTLGYDNADWGTQATLLYNVLGERLSVVGNSGIPDVYEQPRGALDFTISQTLPLGLQLKLSARNLLDTPYSFTMEFPEGESVETERYSAGRSLSIGLGFSFDQMQADQAEETASR